MKTYTLPALLMGLIASSLFIAIGYKGTGINIINLMLSGLFLIASAAIAVFLNLRQNPVIPIRTPDLIALAWIIWLFASIGWSQTPLASFYNAWTVGAFPFAFLLWGWVKPWVRQNHFQTLLLSISFFYAIWAVAEFLYTAQSTHGPMIYQGNLGALFAAALLPQGALYLASPGRQGQKRWLILSWITAIALFSTYSRGAMLSYLFTLPVLLYLAHKQHTLTLPKTTNLVLATVTAFLFIYLYAKFNGGQDMAAKTALDGDTLPGVGSINARLMLWQSTLAIFYNFPLLGSGIGSFVALYPQYRNPDEHSGGFYSHNDYLQFLQEGGPILLILLLLPLILIARILLRCQTQQPNNQSPLQIAAYALAAATFFIHAAADFIFYHIALAILAGFYLSLAYQQMPKPAPLYTLQISEPKLIGAVFALALSLGWGTLAINGHITRNMEYQADWSGARDNKHKDAETILAYHHLNPNHPSPLVRLAELYKFMATNGKDPDEKKHAIAKALNYNLTVLQQAPYASRYYLNLVQLADLFPETRDIIQNRLPQDILPHNNKPLIENLLIQAQQKNPAVEGVNIALALYYQEHKQPRKALAILQQATRWFDVPGRLQSPQDKRKRQQLQQLIKTKIKTLQQKTQANAS